MFSTTKVDENFFYIYAWFFFEYMFVSFYHFILLYSVLMFFLLLQLIYVFYQKKNLSIFFIRILFVLLTSWRLLCVFLNEKKITDRNPIFFSLIFFNYYNVLNLNTKFVNKISFTLKYIGKLETLYFCFFTNI